MSQRRSRMQRTRTGKHLALTDRDIELFRMLSRYRYLRSTYLHAFVGGDSEKRFKERLGDLFHEGYLYRPKEQWRFADARFSPAVHELSKAGREALLLASGTAAEPHAWLQNGPHRQFEHSLMICEVLASIELGVRGRDDIRFIAWPDILAKAPDETRRTEQPYALSAPGVGTVVPDALFGIEYQCDGRKSYRFFALEADRGTMPVVRSGAGTSLFGKLETYHRLLDRQIYRSQLNLPNLLVLTVTTDESRRAEILRRLGENLSEVQQFLFQAMAGPAALTRPRTELLSNPWDRSGPTSLQIDK